MAKRDEFTSKRLKQLLTPDNEHPDGLFPSEYIEALEEFENLIVWKRIPGSDDEIPEPQKGLDTEFDGANQDIINAKAKLEVYLEQIRGKFKNLTKKERERIRFEHIKQRYLIEVPISIANTQKPAELELSSEKK